MNSIIKKIDVKSKLARLKAKLSRSHKSLTAWCVVVLGIVHEAGMEILNFLPTVQQYVDQLTYNKWMFRLSLLVFALNRLRTNKDLADK